MKSHTGAVRASIAAMAILFAAEAAADDSGVHAFLSNLSGEAGGRSAAASPSAPMSAPVYAPADRGARLPDGHRVARLRPVTIHPHKPVVVAAAPAIPTTMRTLPVKVSIYEDTTLRPGDAVMMDGGVKIFVGSHAWPYAKTDFVSLAKARDLNRDTAKVLTALNDLPRI